MVRVFGTRLLSLIRLRGRTCLAWGSDMPGQSLWNSAAKPDKAEKPDMFGLGPDIFDQSL
jgi:hypothetical protein